MFWLLIAIFFATDGSKNVQTAIFPTEGACKAKVEQYAKDFTGHSGDLLGIGFKCDGPFDDPTVRKDQT